MLWLARQPRTVNRLQVVHISWNNTGCTATGSVLCSPTCESPPLLLPWVCPASFAPTSPLPLPVLPFLPLTFSNFCSSLGSYGASIFNLLPPDFQKGAKSPAALVSTAQTSRQYRMPCRILRILVACPLTRRAFTPAHFVNNISDSVMARS